MNRQDRNYEIILKDVKAKVEQVSCNVKANSIVNRVLGNTALLVMCYCNALHLAVMNSLTRYFKKVSYSVIVAPLLRYYVH